MNSIEQQDARIDRYLRKEMSKEEETIFETDVRSDKELRCRARFVAQTIKAMKVAQEEEGLMSIGHNGGQRMVAKNPLSAQNKKK